MRQTRSYRLVKSGRSLIALAVVGSKAKSEKPASRMRLLVDTGASYTMLSVEMLEALGYDIHHPIGRVRLLSANGVIVAPLVSIAWFNCLGQFLKDFPVAAHTIQEAGFNGILRMDFLIRCRAVISIAEAKISFRQISGL